MRKVFAPHTLFVFSIFALIVLSAACRSTTPTSTPVPPTSNVPTALPPAPTAPVLTAAPTDIPPTDAPTAVLPTDVPPAAPTDTPAAGAPTSAVEATATTQPSSGVATAIRPATKPASSSGSGTGSGVVEVSGGTPSASVDVTPIKGLYISALRFDPTYPVKNTPIMFYATLVNNTGKDQNYPVCAEIFRPGENKSFGITNCDTVHMAPGTAEFFIGSWVASGIKQCIPVRARVVLHENDTDNVRLVFTTTQGKDLWVDFNMCP